MFLKRGHNKPAIHVYQDNAVSEHYVLTSSARRLGPGLVCPNVADGEMKAIQDPSPLSLVLYNWVVVVLLKNI